MRQKKETLSAVDAAWLHMDTPTNLAMITGIFMFDAPLDFKRVKATVEARLLPYERFTQRIREPRLRLGLPRWETDPSFDLNAHVHRVGLAPPGDQPELQELVGDLMSTPLDMSKPLWQYHVVENCCGGSALVVRLHHCIADGLALVQVLLSMTDADAKAPWPEPPAPRARESAIGRLIRTTGETLDSATALWQEGLEFAGSTTRWMDAALLAADGAAAFNKLVFTPPDKKTLLRGKCGVTKRAAWSQALPLDRIKDVAHAMNGKVNDVLLTAVTGGLRRYLDSRGQSVDGITIRAMVPVNLRAPGEKIKMGNRFGLVILPLPVGIGDPLQRMTVLKHRMDHIKNSPEAAVAFGLLNTMGMTSNQIEQILLRFFASKVSAVMTNVPGPRDTLYFAGQPIQSAMFWVPTPGNLGLGVSIISYAQQVWVGIATDAGLVPDPEAIVQAFEDEFEHLAQVLKPVPAVTVEPAPARQEFALPDSFSDLAERVPVPVRSNGDSAHPEPVGHVTAAPNSITAARELEPMPRQTPMRCQARTRSGEPCRNFAAHGSKLCNRHAALQLKSAAPANLPST